MTLTTRRRSL